MKQRLVTSRMSCQRFELFSSGLNTRKFALSRFRRITSRKKRPISRVDSASTAPGEGTFTAYSRKSGIFKSRNSSPPLARGLALMRRSPSGPVPEAPGPAARPHQTIPRGDSSSSTVRGSQRARPSTCRTSAPDGCANIPRISCVDHFRAGPTLGGAEHDHRPRGTARRHGGLGGIAGLGLDATNVGERVVQRRRQLLMHGLGFVPFDKQWSITHALEVLRQFVVRNASQKTGVRDLEPVEMQDWEHRPVTPRIQEFVAVPTGRERSRLRLSVPHHARDHQVGIVERRSVGVAQRVSEFAPFMNAPRCFRGDMARNATRKLNCLNSRRIPPHPTKSRDRPRCTFLRGTRAQRATGRRDQDR